MVDLHFYTVFFVLVLLDVFPWQPTSCQLTVLSRLSVRATIAGAAKGVCLIPLLSAILSLPSCVVLVCAISVSSSLSPDSDVLCSFAPLILFSDIADSESASDFDSPSELVPAEPCEDEPDDVASALLLSLL